MDWDKVYLIGSTLSMIMLGYLAVRDYIIRKGKAPSEKDQNISAAVKNLAEALNLSSNDLVESLTDASKLRDELNAVKEETRQRVEETSKHREKLEERIVEMEATIEALNREYARETQKLRDEGQILRTRVDDSDKRYKAAKLIIERLVEALKHGNIDLPEIDLNDLSDSVRNWKWPTPPK